MSQSRNVEDRRTEEFIVNENRDKTKDGSFADADMDPIRPSSLLGVALGNNDLERMELDRNLVLTLKEAQQKVKPKKK